MIASVPVHITYEITLADFVVERPPLPVVAYLPGGGLHTGPNEPSPAFGSAADDPTLVHIWQSYVTDLVAAAAEAALYGERVQLIDVEHDREDHRRITTTALGRWGSEHRVHLTIHPNTTGQPDDPHWGVRRPETQRLIDIVLATVRPRLQTMWDIAEDALWGPDIGATRQQTLDGWRVAVAYDSPNLGNEALLEHQANIPLTLLPDLINADISYDDAVDLCGRPDATEVLSTLLALRV